jgi:putative nucleotidyltransferase with HDIG domain
VGELEDLVSKTVAIPTIPKALLRLQEIVADPNSSLADAVKVVEADPGLATRCLKIANSAIYGVRAPRPTLANAAAVIGMRKLRDLAIQTSLVAKYTHLQQQYGFDLGRFWRHCTLTSVVAREIAKKSRAFRAADAEAASACGLLHNIGRLVMIDSFKTDYLSVILPVGGHGPAAVTAEREAFGFDHAAVGGLLGTQWNLSPEIIAVAKNHHGRPGDLPSLAQLVGFASAVAHVLIDQGTEASAPHFTKEVRTLFQIPPGAEQEILRAFGEGAAVDAEAYAT